MRKVRIEDAIGKPLLHDITQVSEGFKGTRFKRGHVIAPEDADVLLDMGKKMLYVAEEDEELVHEEDAARRLASIARCENTVQSGVSEGKIVLSSSVRGFLTIDIGLLNELNGIEDITICSKRNHSRVEKGEKIASMRIVPLYTDEKNLARAEMTAKGRHLFSVHEYEALKIGVVITGSEVYSGRIQDKFQPVIKRKLEAFPHEIIGVSICDDEVSMIAEACAGFLSKGARFLILTGGMSVDADDVTVDAIRQLGFRIVTHGVPSQPGNMTLIAYKDGIPAIGVPSAAISRPVTVLDCVLPSIFAGVEITKDDCIRMANGGLCSMCDLTDEGCHYPNCHFGAY